MQTRIDRFGRVTIPKIVRDHLGLTTGSVLDIEEANHDIVLKMAERAPLIQLEAGVAVYMGQAIGDIESAVQRERDSRLNDLEK